MIFNNESKTEILKARERKKYVWFVKISILAFCVSLMLTFFSEFILNKVNIIIAILLLIIFMLLNVFSDMLGLAITSCQIENLKREVSDENHFKICIKLVKSSDKVSSILCDVVGDICGILCGVSGTMIAYICASLLPESNFNMFLGAIVSALIAGFTVLFKAISKNYAVKNSTKIVKKVVNFIFVLKNLKNQMKHKSRSNKEN